MINGKGYTVEKLGPKLVRIREIGEINEMSKSDVEQAIENVRANRHKYASDVAYLKRLNFFEDVLSTFNGKEQ